MYLLLFLALLLFIIIPELFNKWLAGKETDRIVKALRSTYDDEVRLIERRYERYAPKPADTEQKQTESRT